MIFRLWIIDKRYLQEERVSIQRLLLLIGWVLGQFLTSVRTTWPHTTSGACTSSCITTVTPLSCLVQAVY